MDRVIHQTISQQGEIIRTSVTFRGLNQTSLILVFREYIDQETNETNWAEVLFSFEEEDTLKDLKQVRLVAKEIRRK